MPRLQSINPPSPHNHKNLIQIFRLKYPADIPTDTVPDIKAFFRLKHESRDSGFSLGAHYRLSIFQAVLSRDLLTRAIVGSPKGVVRHFTRIGCPALGDEVLGS